jgi:hypothetical protein
MSRLALRAAFVGGSALLAVPAQGGALISHGQTQLFVEDYGAVSLFVGGGTPVLGSREGWGVAVTSSFPFSEATAASPFGTTGLGIGLFGSTASSASSFVNLTGTPVDVRHDFGPSADPDTFLVNVSIINSGAAPGPITALEYRRAIALNVPTGSGVLTLTHAGINAPNLAPTGNIQNAGVYDGQPLNPVTVPIIGPFNNSNFADATGGGFSLGSYFDLEFGSPIAPGGFRNFNLFYGSKPTETAAVAALTALGAQAWSIVQDPTAFGPGDPAWYVGLYGIDGTVPGSTASTPILPFSPAPLSFVFINPPQTAWFDPPAADAFRYELDGATFLTVGAPPASFGFGTVDVFVGGVDVGDLAPGGLFDLSSFATSVFELRNIAPAIDLGDPSASRAFPTFLDFTAGATELRMIGLVTDVPAPPLVALFGLGALALGLARRR